MQLTPNIYVETRYSGANVSCVSTSEGSILIESPHLPTDAMEWRKTCSEFGTVKYLINTESHSDHTNGAALYDVTVVAQELTREAIKKIDVDVTINTIRMIDPDGFSLMENFQYNLPKITFDERMTIYLGDHSFHLYHLPGHTIGQTAVHVPEERALFTGDNITHCEMGYLHEAEPFLWLESLQKLREFDVDYIVPGHGEPCTTDYIDTEERYVRDCIDAVQEAIDAGWSRDESIEKVYLPHPYPFEKGMEEHGPFLLRLSVGNLYDKLSCKK